uniref:Inactive tyrosine-protein kinase PEAK1 n=1 Tax=Myripristis murdjan TaxID=586833 RepID=A0A667Z328_9TELE
MSACSDFAEHVWKPGSCKNCFHPLSAHRSVGGSLDGSSPAVCLRASLGGDEETGVTVPSPYHHTKPTIAVKPTMMNPDANDLMTDVNRNIEQVRRTHGLIYYLCYLFMDGIEFIVSFYQSAITFLSFDVFMWQENTKSPGEHVGLKKLLDLSSLYIDSNGCNKALREAVLQSPGTKMDYKNCFSSGALTPLSPTTPPKDSTIISTIFVTQEEQRGSQSLKENANGEHCRQQSSTTTTTRSIKSTCNGSGVVASRAPCQEAHQAPVEIPLSVDIIASSPATGHSNGISTGKTAAVTTEPSSTSLTSSSTALTLDTATHNTQPSLHSPPFLSETTSLSDSSCSHRSSTDSLPGPEGSGGVQVTSESPKSPGAMGSSQSAPHTPNGPADIEPIYAESTKKKRRPHGTGAQSQPQSQSQSPSQSSSVGSELELSGESQRATITVVAAHTEENNRTFYLSSPDSAVSTQCFSPTARKEPSSPAFRWPSPSHSAPSLVTEPSLGPPLQPKPQSSPPIPPKRNIHSQRLHICLYSHVNVYDYDDTCRHRTHLTTSCSSPLYRVCGKMSGSNMELDRCSQQGSVESLTQSLRGLGSASLPTASTDSLTADTGKYHAHCGFRSPMASNPGSPRPDPFNSSQPPPLPEKKMVNRTVSAPDSTNGKPFVRAYPRLPFTGSESNVCRPGDGSSRSSLPSSPVDQRPLFSSNESLEHCNTPLGRPSRSRTLDESQKGRGRLGVHCQPCPAPSLGSSLQLQTLLSNIDSREGVYSKLGGLYAESLRRLALKCEDHFTRSQRNPLRFEESNWSLFKLTCNKPSCNAGDAVYYSAACASDPSNSYAVKICKSSSVEAKQGHLYGLSVQQSMPPHFNLQQDCGHFIACVPQSMLPSDEVSLPTTPASSLPQPPASVPCQQTDRERVVVITREVPQQSAADFVREWEAFHKTQPEVYERRVCFLLLQLCNGLEHLKEHGVTHRDLCLENLLLVPHRRNGSGALDIQRHLPRLLISNFAKAKRRSSEDAASASVDPRVKRDHARLAPEIVSAAQYRKFDEFQTGILIYELLHQPNPFEVSPALKEQDYRCEDLPPIPAVSLYSSGLQRLAQLLLQPDPIKRIHIQEAKRVLQSLLWGPRKDLMEQQWERHGPGGGFAEGSRHEGLLNWLDVKRALLMMKFAERSLEPERNAELEDWLCCQYFSSAHPLSLCHTAELHASTSLSAPYLL